MLVQIRDRAALSSLSIMSLRSYLNSHGWKKEGPWGKRPATIYTKEHGGRRWEVLVPVRDTIADYAESMAEAVSVLASVEERSQLDVFYDLMGVGSDIIHMRPVNGLAKEPLSLRQSTSLLNSAYNMLAAAARAVEKPQATYRGSVSSDVTEYLDNVKPVHRFPEGYTNGYTLTLHSPVPAGFGTQLDLGDTFHTPFPRRATRRLGQALEHTSAAVSKAVAGDTLEPFDEVVQYGVSANLCDSVAELAKKGKGIAIDLIWAEVRPAGVTTPHFRFSEDSAEILTEAAKSFRRNEPSYDEQVIAQVVRLEREPDEFDGKAIIVSARDNRLIRMSVEFHESVYDTVISAFRDQEFISLDGDIYLVGGGYELRNPRNLSVMSEV